MVLLQYVSITQKGENVKQGAFSPFWVIDTHQLIQYFCQKIISINMAYCYFIENQYCNSFNFNQL